MSAASSRITVMAHLVAGYPSTDIARAAARGLAEGGVSYFEIQFPFSDPSADGTARLSRPHAPRSFPADIGSTRVSLS
jgi:tryptophan synthase alpha subunit